MQRILFDKVVFKIDIELQKGCRKVSLQPNYKAITKYTDFNLHVILLHILQITVHLICDLNLPRSKSSHTPYTYLKIMGNDRAEKENITLYGNLLYCTHVVRVFVWYLAHRPDWLLNWLPEEASLIGSPGLASISIIRCNLRLFHGVQNLHSSEKVKGLALFHSLVV